MTNLDICKQISQNLTHNLRLADSDDERLEYIVTALKRFNENVIPSLNAAYDRYGERSPELERARGPALDLATFICGVLVRKCTRYSRGIDCLEGVSAGCLDPVMKQKLVFYTNQLKKRWNVAEPGGLVHNPRAKRVRTEVPVANPAVDILKAIILLGVCLFLFLQLDLTSIVFPNLNNRETAKIVPHEKVQGHQESFLQGDSKEQPPFPVADQSQFKSSKGAIYTYTDNQGVVHMVDNVDKVPPEHRQGMNITDSAVSPRASTPVAIQGNQVIVPVTIVFRGRSVETRLLLDTGASITTINESLAARLGVGADSVKAGKATVADGRSVGAYRFKADSLAVSDHVLPFAEASILPGSGGQGYEGLLGMNFLKKFRYHINFDQRVIEWG